MKITRVINVAALMLGVLLLCQCTKEEKSAVQPQANVPATVKMAYIDSDSLAAKYNFAKDIFEANQRAQNKLENVRQQKAAELQRFQSEIEQKGRNNGYLTEESYKADMQKYQQMGYDAERHMNDLQNKFVNENNLSLKQLNDSIDKCISEYAKKERHLCGARQESHILCQRNPQHHQRHCKDSQRALQQSREKITAKRFATNRFF